MPRPAEHPRLSPDHSAARAYHYLDRTLARRKRSGRANGVTGLQEPSPKPLDRAHLDSEAAIVTVRDESVSTLYCRRILEHRESGTLLKEQAVLFGLQPIGPLEIDLPAETPVVKFGGLKFATLLYHDIWRCLRFVENPAIARGLPAAAFAAGIGSATAQRGSTVMADADAPSRCSEHTDAAALRRRLERLFETLAPSNIRMAVDLERALIWD